MWPNRELLIAAGMSVLAWVLSVAFTGNIALGLPFAVGLFIFCLQMANLGLVRDMDQDRDDLIILLQSVIPKLRVGLQIDEAFVRAAAELNQSPAANVVGSYCAKAQLGIDLSGERVPKTSATSSALIAIIATSRQTGGYAEPSFSTLTAMLETDQRIRRKQSVATLHVRAQANALLGIASIILVFALFANQSSFLFLRETVDGRLMVLYALTSVIWGYILLTELTRRIADA